jgi:hypothetical protein
MIIGRRRPKQEKREEATYGSPKQDEGRTVISPGAPLVPQSSQATPTDEGVAGEGQQPDKVSAGEGNQPDEVPAGKGKSGDGDK